MVNIQIPAVVEYLNCHYVFNLLASMVFLSSKLFHPVCIKLYDLNDDGECQLDWRDSEILMFLCLVLLVKNRRWKPLSTKELVSNIFLFAKCANLLLFVRHDSRYAFFYALLCLLLFLVFPEPTYTGQDNVMFFRGQALDEMLLHEPEKVLLVEFYATWSPACSRFSSAFASLSIKYDNDHFKFGKLDVTRYPVIAKKYKIDNSVSSRNLPTLVLFENGKEKMRRPIVDYKGLVTNYVFREENVIRDFNLNELYATTKKRSSKRDEKKSKKEN